mgnify:CR=1 FL=1
MTHHPRLSSFWRPAVAVGLVLGLTSAAFAAEAPRPPSSEAVQLSPFLVSTAGDEGYRAANTLSGTRMNASLFHTPAAISVLTKDFLDDIGAENVADMLKFATSSDNDRTDSGNLAQAWDVRATIRGFTESVITRDYLPNMVQGRGILANDRFNVDRADEITVTARMPAEGVGPIDIDTTVAGPNHVTTNSADFPIAGVWEIIVTARYGEFDQVVFTGQLTVQQR